MKKIWTGLLLILLCTLTIGMSVFAADTTMKNKKWVSGKGGSYVDTDNDGMIDDFRSSGMAYYKIKISKQGYIMVNVNTSSLPGEKEYYLDFDESGEESTMVRFLNSKKKELISVSNYLEDGKSMIFSSAVKKGTYYLEVSGDQKYKLRYIFTSVPKVSKAGKTMGKAVTLKKGVTVKRLFFGDSQRISLTTFGDYYKIKLPKKTKVTLECNSKIKGQSLSELEVYVYVKKGKNYRCVNKKGISYKDGDMGTSFDGKGTVTYTLPKGTYYVRALSTSGSGYYTMKWK